MAQMSKPTADQIKIKTALKRFPEETASYDKLEGKIKELFPNEVCPTPEAIRHFVKHSAWGGWFICLSGGSVQLTKDADEETAA